MFFLPYSAYVWYYVRTVGSEPVRVYRGHESGGMITSVCVDSEYDRAITTGVDGQIMVWAMPDFHAKGEMYVMLAISGLLWYAIHTLTMKSLRYSFHCPSLPLPLHDIHSETPPGKNENTFATRVCGIDHLTAREALCSVICFL